METKVNEGVMMKRPLLENDVRRDDSWFLWMLQAK